MNADVDTVMHLNNRLKPVLIGRVRKATAGLGLLLLLSLLTGCDQSAERASPSGFAGLDASGEGFTEVLPGHTLSFPEDHAPHPTFRTEWWYLTANLQGPDGTPYGVQWTLFRQPLDADTPRSGWQNQQLWMGHAAITSAEQHLHSENFARGGIGQADVQLTPFHAWIDNWQLLSLADTGDDPLSHLHLEATTETFSYQLSLTTDRQVVLQGDQGFSLKSEQGQASYYYSQPFFAAEGELQIGDQVIPVTGQAWMDREWSSQWLAEGQQGWDWFSLHLETGEKLMLFQLRHTADKPFHSGTWISAEGNTEPLQDAVVIMTPLHHTPVAGKQLPTAWEIEIPHRELKTQVSALNPTAWMDTTYPYWEGPISIDGSHQGVGYLEMTGY